MRKASIIFSGILLATMLIIAITACGGSTTTSSGGTASTATTPTSVIAAQTTPTPPTPTQQQTGTDDVSGIWNGTWANITPDNATGSFSVQLSQQGSALTGNISIVGTPCLTGGSVTGSINGSTINFGVVAGEVTVNYAGTILSNNTMSGTYATNCGNANGGWQAAKQ